MKNTVALGCVLLLSLFVGCSSVSVKTDYDHTEDFSKYKTFTLFSGELAPGNALSKYPELKERMYPVVKEILVEKGFIYKESEITDFVVHLRGAVNAQTQRTKQGGRTWYNPWWGSGRTVVSYYDEGSLIIDIVNTAEKNLSWRGIGSKIVDQGNMSGVYDRSQLKKNLEKILKGFPPKAE